MMIRTQKTKKMQMIKMQKVKKIKKERITLMLGKNLVLTISFNLKLSILSHGPFGQF